jgi:hypothetical protein
MFYSCRKLATNSFEDLRHQSIGFVFFLPFLQLLLSLDLCKFFILSLSLLSKLLLSEESILRCNIKLLNSERKQNGFYILNGGGGRGSRTTLSGRVPLYLSTWSLRRWRLMLPRSWRLSLNRARHLRLPSALLMKFGLRFFNIS